ncbi:hypothetical protein FSP39_017219 [Pinctada imbricata]|uniref:WD repeat-containing protein 18 n=1 Tax=Pinctada imbricata TaxID=66713 RepID=A0AA88Y1T7_PINIB|nr:hypothetical protein FSP39_017219 [Pinctada imbricata]
MVHQLKVLLTSEVTGQLSNVTVWDPESAIGILTYKGGTTVHHGLSLLAGQYILGASPAKPLLHVWALQKRDHMQMKMVCPGRVTALDCTPDGAYCIAAISEKVHIWQTCTGHLLTVLSRHYQDVHCLRCTEDGSFFVTGGDDNLVIAWSLPKVLAESMGPGLQVKPHHVWSNHSLPITDIHIGIGGCLARVVSSSLDQTCRMWDVNTGDPLCTFVFDTAIHSVTMDPSEFRLYAGGSNGTIFTVNLFQSPSSFERHIVTDQSDNSAVQYKGHEKQVTCLCVSLDGNKLYSGSNDSSVKIWDIFSGQCLKTLPHKGAVTNAFIISTPPGVINSDLKSTLPIQTFQRHLYSRGQESSGEQSNDTGTLNVFLTEEDDETVEQDSRYNVLYELAREAGSQNKESKKTKDEEIQDLKAEINKLKAANSELYQYAVTHILQKESTIT